jgi:small ligand-binding sensory domain FIST
MKWASSVSQLPDGSRALAEALFAARQALGAHEPDLALLFFTPHHAGVLPALLAELERRAPQAVVAGCVAPGVIAGGSEVTQGPGLAIALAALPGVLVRPLVLADDRAPELPPGVGEPTFLIFADPHACPVEPLLAAMDARYPASRKLGVMIGGGEVPRLLVAGEQVLTTGAVAVVLRGNVDVSVVTVSGCRPIGEPLVVGRVKGDVVLELGGRPVGVALERLHHSLPARDRELSRHSLFLGFEVDSGAIEFRSGELLVRNILGVDRATGGLRVGTRPHPFQVVQFMLRDPEVAAAELDRRLGAIARAKVGGALLFTRAGRGAGLYGAECESHDCDRFAARFPGVSLAGCLGGGQIAPCGASTWLHGYTSTFGLFSQAQDDRVVRTAEQGDLVV